MSRSGSIWSISSCKRCGEKIVSDPVKCINCGSVFHPSCAKLFSGVILMTDSTVMCCESTHNFNTQAAKNKPASYHQTVADMLDQKDEVILGLSDRVASLNSQVEFFRKIYSQPEGLSHDDSLMQEPLMDFLQTTRTKERGTLYRNDGASQLYENTPERHTTELEITKKQKEDFEDKESLLSDESEEKVKDRRKKSANITVIGTAIIVPNVYVFLNHENTNTMRGFQADVKNLIPEANLCPDGQFCDTSSNRCNKCDRCYNVFQHYIKTTTGDVENILRNLIQKYRRHLNELQTLVQTIITNINMTEPELGQVNTQSAQVQKKVKHVQQLMRKLRNDITKLQNELKKIGKLTSIEDVVSELKTIKNSVEEIQNKLQKLSFDTDDVALLDLDKFNNVGSALDDMNKRFPILEKTSLSLALSIESDIDLLESMISSFAGKPKGLPANATANTNWIEDDLLWLFTTLKNYENVSVDINALESNAINTTATARQTLSTLEDLLEKHKAFEKHLKDLKSETDFYKELQKLKERFKLRMDEIQEFKRLLTILMRVVELEKQASSFDNERKQLEKKEKEFKEKYMGELNRLGDELNSVLEQYESLGTTPQEVDLTEIEKMYKEADDIQKEVKKQCKSKIK